MTYPSFHFQKSTIEALEKCVTYVNKLTTKTPERRHFRIRTEYGEIRSISPYSVRMRENDVVLVFYCQL